MSRPTVDKVSSADDRTLPVFAEFDNILDRIREHAYSLFRQRGSRDGFELDDWLNAEREVCWPAAELEEEDDRYEARIALAGFEPDEVSVTATPGELIVRARHELKSSDKDKGGDAKKEICWSEFRSDEVYRRIHMPQAIDVDRVKAGMKRGLLEIEAPKAPVAKAEPRNVDISSAA